ncbi:protein kinase [Paeniglutamicibacter sulfureus]|uniref:protein kinase domain-containing protein n=1 Tax=Paeniglutamicibacter sulfureus TaxID=43666 RepID=UPI00266583F7|nr:protein kinase [Paeniglutamicibacter sulfureus]MDO2934158.1 protein kinase [Paeniglutamicibacter sulfureus]
MVSVEEERLKRFLKQYDSREVDQTYIQLYLKLHDETRVFASIHERLDTEFEWMNFKARNGGHFNAQNSRNLIELIEEITNLNKALIRVGKSLVIDSEYRRVLEGSKLWLVSSGGSPIPDGFTPVEVEKYAAVFSLEDKTVVLEDRTRVELKMVGSGAFADVFKFTDPNHGIPIAKKKLKRESNNREVERFRREFEIMKKLSFPYIVEVYRFDEAEMSYTMEYCDETLENYVGRRNNQESFDFGVRRRIALQFLYGLNYIHFKGNCHRDLSVKNVLLKVYEGTAVLVKLSDFGLAKERGSDFTQTETELKGTRLDPAVSKFGEFMPVNDIYSVGFILSFIFKGVKHLVAGTSGLAQIVQKCSHSDPSARYQTVAELIREIEALTPETKSTPA